MTKIMTTLKRNIYRDAEHPFAQYIRTVGKGKKGSRSLTEEEAFEAMSMILRGEVLDMQLGAFLMLLRVKEESPEELAGFVKAARAQLNRPENFPAVDLDWSSYAGKRRHYPWFLFAVRILVEKGIKVFMHGAEGHTINRLYTESVLPTLGFRVSEDWNDAASSIQETGFAFMSLDNLSPVLGDIIQMRNVMGLRSPVHTLARLLNPVDASHVIQAIFHPAYRESHQKSALLLGYDNACVFKGEGGEIERNPDGSCLVKYIRNGEPGEEEWPAIYPARHETEESFDMENFLDVWRGRQTHEYGEGAITGTLAIVLRLTGRAASQEEALMTAKGWWMERNKDSL